MKRLFKELKDTILAGVVFLLPLLILIVLLGKAYQLLTGVSTKLASLFGVKTLLGLPGHTIASSVLILIMLLVCGYLVRLTLFRRMYNWLDRKLAEHLPPYKVYRELAMSKLNVQEEMLPYKSAASIVNDGTAQPCFIMDELADGSYVVFIPTAGNVKEGNVAILPANRIQLFPGIDIKLYRNALANQGQGIGKLMVPGAGPGVIQ
ncbi:hypothetical protein [Flavihumibacter solisilvae]|uniref:DUF502 domain-containing protein n=1 Tax=Flavihumibacter solisilvae TaxID=1349421 RepID=A0A0C1L9R3_9BACT|nr:hypothetical protein [Flavihumibacter solisilvae]KIC96266.1 hypothetical protein OI18_00410 [Flavihumibacter solisilvae]